MNQKIINFRDLNIWQLGKTIAKEVYCMTKKFPSSEMYGLQSQMRRAAISIASNIAEGFNRYHNKEYRQFLFIALGSCAELETQLEIAHDVGLIGVEDLKSQIQQITSETKMIRSLIKKL